MKTNKRFDWIFLPEDGKLNPFTLFAKILKETEDTITFEAYADYGNYFVATWTKTKENFYKEYRENKKYETVIFKSPDNKLYRAKIPVPIVDCYEDENITIEWLKKNLKDRELYMLEDFSKLDHIPLPWEKEAV